MNSKQDKTSPKKQNGIFSEGWVERAKQGLRESIHPGQKSFQDSADRVREKVEGKKN